MGSDKPAAKNRQKKHEPIYIGLMSGTSIDAIDAALVAIDNGHVQLLHAINYPIPPPLQQAIAQLCQPGINEIERLSQADRQLGEQYAHAVHALLQQSGYHTNDITAIGNHGQTIRHQAHQSPRYTLQIGDPNTIAYHTNMTTISDFRRKDIAAGGQGAPLAPLFHQAFFKSTPAPRAVVNIGGIANISYLNTDHYPTGYDTGPGNLLMDQWIQRHTQQRYDDKGTWAATGRVIKILLEQMLQDAFFSQRPPKSTGRELFNDRWLIHQLQIMRTDIPFKPEDVQATLLELTAQSISHEVNRLPIAPKDIFICGGGAYNTQLMKRLATLLHPTPVASTTALGMPPEWVEAAGFAWLAHQTLAAQPTDTTTITGADKPVVLGGIYFS